MWILETERLFLREFDICDAQLLIDLNSDEAVTRYTGDGEVKDSAEAEKILTQIILPQYENKIGRWAVHLKTDKEFIGWCGVKYIADAKEYDLGYRFFKKYWNNGYATESANVVVNYAFTTIGIPKLVARAAKANTASIKVIKKLGMVYLNDEHCHLDEAEKYVLFNPII